MRAFIIFLLLVMITPYLYAEKAIMHNNRIVNGIPAIEEAWPWMVSLIYSDSSETTYRHFCGGTLIHSNWVVTAAHCVVSQSALNIEVIVNTTSLEGGTGERIGVNTIIVHPNYNAYTYDSDIALIKLKKSTPATPIQRISSNIDLTGKMAIVTGWGKLSEDSDQYSTILYQAEVPIVSDRSCKEAYSVSDITENMICAGYENGLKDSCKGDSGGPLVVNDQGVWKIVGIVSWSEGCAKPGFYGVYTRISQFNDFIESYVNTASIHGDIDQNGVVNIIDVLMILNHAAIF